jgi:hypothetical protein
VELALTLVVDGHFTGIVAQPIDKAFARMYLTNLHCFKTLVAVAEQYRAA